MRSLTKDHSGHCKRLAPEYEAAAKALSKAPTPVHFAKVDTPTERALASEYGIRGFPTLIFFK